MTARDVERMKLEHLYTEALDSLGGIPTRWAGLTEWVCRQDGATISLAWDWVRLDDGALVECFDCPVRSNVMILDDKGYDLGPEASAAMLQEKIRATAWQRDVAASQAGASMAPIAPFSACVTYLS